MIRRSRLHVMASLLPLVLPLAAGAQTYPPVPPAPPDTGISVDLLYRFYYPRSHLLLDASSSDIVMQEGIAETFVFKMLNLTPYRMELTEASRALLAERTGKSQSRTNLGAFAFAPLGVPSVIPPGTIDLAGMLGDPATHPRNFVLGWHRWGEYPTVQTHLNWVVKDVRYPPCVDSGDPATCTTNDLYLGLWLSYVQPTDALAEGSFTMIQSMTEEMLAFLGVLTDPLNPLAWMAFGFATHNIVEAGTAFGEQQRTPDEGQKVYVSAYVIPDWNRNCFILNNPYTWQYTGHTGEPQPPAYYQSCSPTTSRTGSEDSDAYDAGWDKYFAGDGPAALVVLTTGLRGRAAHPTPRGANSNEDVQLGSLPVVSVVVMTGQQYEMAQALLIMSQRPPMATARPGPVDLDKEKVVKEARKFRDKYGVEDARRALGWTVVSLGPEERLVLREAVLTLLDRNPLQTEQERFLLGLLKRAERLVKDWRKEG